MNEQMIRIRLNALIRQVWGAMRDLSDCRDGNALTDEDMELWGCVTKHPAVQRVLDKAFAKDQVDQQKG